MEPGPHRMQPPVSLMSHSRLLPSATIFSPPDTCLPGMSARNRSLTTCTSCSHRSGLTCDQARKSLSCICRNMSTSPVTPSSKSASVSERSSPTGCLPSSGNIGVESPSGCPPSTGKTGVWSISSRGKRKELQGKAILHCTLLTNQNNSPIPVIQYWETPALTLLHYFNNDRKKKSFEVSHFWHQIVACRV